MSQAGYQNSDTPRGANKTNFTINAQEKAATRGGQRGALQFSVVFPYCTPNESNPASVVKAVPYRTPLISHASMLQPRIQILRIYIQNQSHRPQSTTRL
eukprot:COSAG02_NODE_21612_length_781_cov_1.331378_1_plen_99_part_00